MASDQGCFRLGPGFNWQRTDLGLNGEAAVMACLLEELKSRYYNTLLPDLPPRMVRLAATLAVREQSQRSGPLLDGG